eukprot:Amastigsp_a179459_26.p6 type:complete len:102 gc:universal Amastigsp_a179459_26:917-1222(+)
MALQPSPSSTGRSASSASSSLFSGRCESSRVVCARVQPTQSVAHQSPDSGARVWRPTVVNLAHRVEFRRNKQTASDALCRAHCDSRCRRLASRRSVALSRQ